MPKIGSDTAPTIAPKYAPKKAPIIKIMIPPAPPDNIPHKAPIKGMVKSIASQDVFSSSRTTFPISLPEKNPTTAAIKFTIAITPRIQSSFLLKPPLSKINFKRLQRAEMSQEASQKKQRFFRCPLDF